MVFAEDVVYNDEAPWNVAIKQWIEYLPVVPEFLRGNSFLQCLYWLFFLLYMRLNYVVIELIVQFF